MLNSQHPFPEDDEAGADSIYDKKPYQPTTKEIVIAVLVVAAAITFIIYSLTPSKP